MKNKIHSCNLIVAICLSLISCSSEENKTAQQQPEPIKQIQTVDPGKQLFEEKCIACHGSDGAAGIANAANLQKSNLDSTTVIQTITNGKNTMPAFRGQLETNEIELISKYVSTLRK